MLVVDCCPGLSSTRIVSAHWTDFLLSENQEEVIFPICLRMIHQLCRSSPGTHLPTHTFIATLTAETRISPQLASQWTVRTNTSRPALELCHQMNLLPIVRQTQNQMAPLPIIFQNPNRMTSSPTVCQSPNNQMTSSPTVRQTPNSHFQVQQTRTSLLSRGAEHNNSPLVHL